MAVDEEKLPPGPGRPIPPPRPDAVGYTVDFDGPDDPTHPYNWSGPFKHSTALLVCSGTLIESYTSAAFAPGAAAAAAELGLGATAARLGTTLYVLGFAFGPALWAPLSELWGRRWPLTASMLAGGAFALGTATARGGGALLACRFLGGLCGACQFSVAPGVVADVYAAGPRGVALVLYTLAVFLGPFGAPVAGGFITARLGWRWTLYVPALLALANGALSLLFLRETSAPCLLAARAAVLRRKTGRDDIRAPHETAGVDVRALADKYFARPLRMLATEPILLLISLYMSFIYGITYCLLAGYPHVFGRIRGLPPGLAGLPFLGLVVGQLAGLAFALSRQAAYARRLAAHGNVAVPEWRLAPALVGAPAFALGVFAFGWTGFRADIHWAAPTAAGVLIGFGIFCVFQPCFTYIIDAYLPITASAVAANIILRSSIAAGFPLFSTQMFEGMGVQWACTLLGGLSTVMIPIPFAFRIYGPLLRKKSAYLIDSHAC